MKQRNNFSGDKMLIHKPNRFLKYNVREVKTFSSSADQKNYTFIKQSAALFKQPGKSLTSTLYSQEFEFKLVSLILC